jgi:fructose-1-phosphate kinase PfkB-like protein
MMAGLAYGFAHGFGFAKAVKYGVAAGTANTLIIGAGQFTIAEFNDIYGNLKIR